MVDLNGIIFVVLEGQENYHRWARSFQNAAVAAGVWELFSGEVTIVEASLAKKQSSDNDRASSDYRAKHSVNRGCYTLPHSLSTSARIRFEQDNKGELINRAKILLRQSLTPDIADILSSYYNPEQAWDFLYSRYKAEDPAEHAWNHMDALSSCQYGKLSQFINAVIRAQFEINHEGGCFDDNAVKAKIIDAVSMENKVAVKASGLVRRAQDLSMRQFISEILRMQRS